MENLISEAEKRASEIIEEKNPQLSNKEQIAKSVALAALKYFDLSHNRTTEIVFDWGKALSFDGNTGPYLQYTHARIYGILRKAENLEELFLEWDLLALKPEELIVLRKLHQFPEILKFIASDFLPSVLCTYLFELSQNFNTFYQAVPILKEDDNSKRHFRLALIQATAQILKNGLDLLGIEAPEEM